ncbi:MAG TPA: serine hydrolase domain-containing protein [Candidatus Angelobacter sp.]|nr:serine hydrolase domain-containing protein [Candidatus Angelobacter sp.]
MQRGIDERAFPGASVAVAYRGKLVALKGLGRFTYESSSAVVTPETVYDLASLTKVVSTTAICMVLYERGTFHLEQKLMDLLPGFRNSDSRKEHITLRMLLTHSSGLPGYVRLFETAAKREELIRQAMETPLEADPGSRAEYSDIGFILLGEALEKLAGASLDQLAAREIFAPLGLKTIGFSPPQSWQAMIPPTEDDRTFRKRIIRGEVNDENAWVMGGVAGHAGVFAATAEVAGYAQCMLNGGAPLLKAHTVDLFTHRENSPSGTSRALGWDTPSAPSQSGRHFSARSYGHLGFTGTSLWIDPERQLSVTLLTNRTWPDRSPQGIKTIRPAFHDAVVEALG